MKIAILGSGNVGSALAKRWVETGHEVVLGSRNPDNEANRKHAADLGAGFAGIPEAVGQCEVVALAVPWGAVEKVLEMCGDLNGKILLDATNPLLPELAGLEVGHTSSGAERVAELAKGARVVKIFNTTGSGNVVDPDYGDRRLSMILAGDDDEANETAAQLASDIGFEPFVIGGLQEARLLEPLAMTWITLAYKGGLGPDFALTVVRRGEAGG